MNESDWKVSATEGFSEPDKYKEKEAIHYIEYTTMHFFPNYVESDIRSWCIQNKDKIADSLMDEKDEKITSLIFTRKVFTEGAEVSPVCYCAEGRVLSEFGFSPEAKKTGYGMRFMKEIRGDIYDISNYQSFPDEVIPFLNLSKLFTKKEIKKSKYIFRYRLGNNKKSLEFTELQKEAARRLYKVIHEEDKDAYGNEEELAAFIARYFERAESLSDIRFSLAVINDGYLAKAKTFKEIARLIRFFW